MSLSRTFLSIFLLFFTFLQPIIAQDTPKTGLPEGAIARLGKGGINILRFSPDGSCLAVGTDVGVWVYDVSDGTGTALSSENYGQVSTLVFSSDGSILAGGGGDNPNITIWKLDTGKILSTLKVKSKHPNITDLFFHDSFLISVNDHYDVMKWGIHTIKGVLNSELDNSEKTVSSTNEKIIFYGDSSGKITIRNLINGDRVATLNGHKDSTEPEIITLAATEDNKILASAGRDMTIQLWDIPNQIQLATIQKHKVWVTSLAFSEDRKILASGYASNVIKLWNVYTQREISTLRGHKNTINALAFSPESTPTYGACLASGSADGTIRFWDLKTEKELMTFTDGHTEWVKAIAFNKTDSQVVSAAYNGGIEKWNLQTNLREATFTTAQFDDTESVMLSSDGAHYAVLGKKGTQFAFEQDSWGYKSTGSYRSSFQLWNLTTEQKIPGPWHSLFVKIAGSAFSPDSNLFVYDNSKEIIIVDFNTKSELFRIDEKSFFDRKFAISPDGKLLAFTNKSGKARIFVLDTQHQIDLPYEDRSSVFAFSPDSSTFATKGMNIQIWKMDSDKKGENKVLSNSFFAMNNVMTFSPDGNILVCYNLDTHEDRWRYGIKLIDIPTDKVLDILSGHTEPIQTLVFSHNGKILASGSMDGTILLWNWEEIISQLKKDG